ncbi:MULTISPECIES: TIGR03085 family metal-binding protein [unclassified Plantactinospora]|uniref:TIGR03085 family metal-binding protein n=1 Tax=unclassified Plantactinospora TaxID=2631981 RepID=UPI000D159851|nr:MULTISPECIES: TIGR03085 family metal-binding protein [unclassified Plantactinospora]AVT32664.1 TIGR03085 family protein [Plantactinospora sp. BC1]AVT39305.1 TIGR03085 family protein [Plantactinospora sp. BB1]
MPRYADTERQSLADLLLAIGPDGPTIIPEWAAKDLAAHLVVRERRPDAAAGLLLPPLRAHGTRVQAAMAGRPYPALVELVRRPPRWSPLALPPIDELANLVEYFVHHEDVRRARPDWQPRELPAGQRAALWKRIPAMARMSLRRFPAALLIQAPEHGETTAGAGGEQLRMVGSPGELMMFLFGRQRAARVQLVGPTALTERLRTAKLGI